MEIAITSHLNYSIYPEVLARWLFTQSEEEQALFLWNYLAMFNAEQVAKFCTDCCYGGVELADILRDFATKVEAAMRERFDENN